VVKDYLIQRVLPDEPKVNGGNRTEITVEFPFSFGGQWHNQPDTNNGETWGDVPSRNPPISIGYIALDGHDYIGLSDL